MFSNVTFTNPNGQTVPYDGSPVTWRVSAYAVIIENSSILLVKGNGESFYDVVGGGVRMNESIEEALRREALEEAGAKIKPAAFIGYHQDYFYHTGERAFYRTLLLYFHTERVGMLQKPRDPKITFCEFIKIKNMNLYPTLPYVNRIVHLAFHKQG